MSSKKRPGRPRQLDGVRQVHAILDDETWKICDRAATKLGVTMSQVIRDALRFYANGRVMQTPDKVFHFGGVEVPSTPLYQYGLDRTTKADRAGRRKS